MKVVIFHGSYGNPEENWTPWLKQKIEQKGYEVVVPNFPCEDWDYVTKQGENYISDKQTLNNWIRVFKNLNLDLDEEYIFIGHSLGPVFILHLIEKFNIKLNGAIFVSPFLEDIKSDWHFYSVNKSFYKTNFDFENIKNHISKSYVLYGDDDPYVEYKYFKDFADKIGSEMIAIKGGKHLNESAGFKEFPKLLEIAMELISR